MLRKLGIVLGVIVGLAAVVVAWAWWTTGRIAVQRVTNNVYMLTGVGGNVGVLVTNEGVVVVDTMTFVRQGQAIRERIRELTNQPVVAVINTHYHLDHTHGNPAFVPGTKVVATTNTLKNLRERDSAFWQDSPAKDLLPNETFEQTHELHIGGKTVQSHFFGHGHTNGDLVVQFVEDKVIHTGDLFFNGHFPNIDLEAGGSVREWPATLEQVFNIDFDTVIPGHGALSNRDGLRKFQEFMASLWSQTKAVVDRGGSVDDALQQVDIDRFGLIRIWFVPSLNRDF